MKNLTKVLIQIFDTEKRVEHLYINRCDKEKQLVAFTYGGRDFEMTEDGELLIFPFDSKLGERGEICSQIEINEWAEIFQKKLNELQKQPVITEQDYKDAVNVQNACNLSGIVNSLQEVVKKVREEAKLKPETNHTNWINTHPIVQAYVYKLMDLSLGMSPYETGYHSLKVCGDKMEPEPDFRFKELSKEEEFEYKSWAHEHYCIGSEISEVWHPIIQAECKLINEGKRMMEIK